MIIWEIMPTANEESEGDEDEDQQEDKDDDDKDEEEDDSNYEEENEELQAATRSCRRLPRHCSRPVGGVALRRDFMARLAVCDRWCRLSGLGSR